MKLEANARYAQSHEWVRQDEGEIVCGITDHAQGLLGDIVFVELPEAGSDVKQMEPFGTIEAVKAVSELFSPITGAVEAVNGKIEEDAGLINTDPYGGGWMIKIKFSDTSELGELLSPDW